MAQCCNNCYPICTPYPSCPSALFIAVPPNYTEPNITINIIKPGVNANMQQLLPVDSGIVQPELIGDFSNFLNPWGGQYSIYFTNPTTNEQLTFTAVDGKDYDSICLTFVQTLTNLTEQTILINVFTNEY
jgi:hypothetical protein